MGKKKKQELAMIKFLEDNPEINSWVSKKSENKNIVLNTLKEKEESEQDSEKKKLYKERISNFDDEAYWPLKNEKNIIELTNVYKYYNSGGYVTKVLHGLNLEIPKSKITIILGPSGSGKTTLLNLISGLALADAGDVVTDSRNLSYLNEKNLVDFRAKHVSFIFQSYNLIPTLSVWDNVKIGTEISKGTDYKSNIDMEDLLKKLDIYDQKDKFPYQLSGGQKQRVSIARAIVKDPEIIFADEPTGALDTDMAREVFGILVKLSREYGKTLVIVTHDPKYSSVADQVVEFDNGVVKKITTNKTPIDPSKIK